jgi:hypothetical protein
MPTELYPTADPHVNAILRLLEAEVRGALGAQFAGMYLYGSLASGDFDSATSDVDFLVVTAGPLSESAIASLAAMHARIGASGTKWASKLEGSYLASSALRRYAPADPAAWPTLNEGQFYLAPHGWDWVIQRHVLREHGVVVAGPPIRPLIDPVTPTELRRAVCELLREWWAPMLDAPSRLATDEYQAYAILSMCRALHALESGTIVSKPRAAAWAQQRLGEPWPRSIERALAWRPDIQLDEVPAALDLIRHALAASAEWRARHMSF